MVEPVKRLAVLVATFVAGGSLAGPHAAGPAPIRFEEIAKKAGVQARHHTRVFKGDSGDVLRMFTSGGAAVAVGDYDNDGFDDLFVTDSGEGRTSHLYHNNGDMTFKIGRAHV